MLDVNKEFRPDCKSVHEFFQEPGTGFYIPIYQREYSWDSENINQLMEDICYGVENLLQDKNAVRFLGSVIRIRSGSVPEDVSEPKAKPSRADIVIDGQQRITSIALLASLLYQRISALKSQISVESPLSELSDAISNRLRTLEDLFSLDLRRGSPKRKPILIRESVDKWAFDGADEDFYKSSEALYVATFIRAIVNGGDHFPSIQKKVDEEKNARVRLNLGHMNNRLIQVENAHRNNDDGNRNVNEDFSYPQAKKIIESIEQEDIWDYERAHLRERLLETGDEEILEDDSLLCSLVQLFAFHHYLTARCFFSVIEPTTEEWAFDMFQSLNATGTPLTAIETFRPLVLNTVKQERKDFSGSEEEKHLSKIDELFQNTNSASAKDKLTNEYLTAFALAYSGHKLPRQFSKQRLWLTQNYNRSDDKAEFLQRMADVADYWTNIVKYNRELQGPIPHYESLSVDQRQLMTLCLLYLQDAGHRIAHAVLSRFHSKVIRNKDEFSVTEFIKACKMIAAFFTIWRSAKSNAGLDDVYRGLLRKPQISWQGSEASLTSAELSKSLLKELKNQDIGDSSSWKERAVRELRFDNGRQVCRFSLFVSAHNTMPDTDYPGLMKKARDGSNPLLKAEHWLDSNLREIEHIAPKKQDADSSWDERLYTADQEYELIGNLTLLAPEINKSISNRNWKAKWLCYCHLAEGDSSKLEELSALAKGNKVDLQVDTLERLKKAEVKHYVQPITAVGIDGQWCVELVERRTSRICDIVWDRMSVWLG